MSKGNLFLGYGRGKIGDIVLTRGEGQQISRARNRSPRNPKTEKQMYQRAVMASVMAMYKAGKTIFDHSFQGKQVALGSMKRFMSVNAKKLRENIVADLENNTVTSSVISPGAVSSVPYAYRISEGTMPQGLVNTLVASNVVEVGFLVTTGDYVDEKFTPGDIYTIVGVAVYGSSTVNDSLSPSTVFGYTRLTVKDTIPHVLGEEATIADVFEIETFNTFVEGSWTLDEFLTIESLFPNSAGKGALGVIHSREDSGLRSTSEMVCSPTVSWGVAPANIATVWNASVQGLGNSELILEGGDI